MSAPAAGPSEPVQFGAPAEAKGAKPARPVRLWNARHGVAIAAVFATEDGAAAASIDENGFVRLWPALDGSREPLVVPFTLPTTIALERDGDGYALAALDEAGGFELAAISAAGEMTAHVKQPPEPGFDAVIANGRGFIALRRDQTLLELDHKGAQVATLSPAPGEHVMKLLARKAGTLAIVRTKEGMRGHWLADDKLAWGGDTPKLTSLNLKRTFLSPDHKRLVTFRDFSDSDEAAVILVDLETGKNRPLENHVSFSAPQGVPIGFSADQRVVLAFNDFELSTVEWWHQNGTTNAMIGGSTYSLEFVNVDAAVVTDANVIAFSGEEIAIVRANTASSPTEIKFLGYRTNRAKGVKASPAGVVATIGGSSVLLDDRVRIDKRVPALDTIVLAKDLALVNFTANDVAEPVLNIANTIDPDWLEGAKKKPKHGSNAPRVALFDLATKKELQRWPAAKRIWFEPASQLMAIKRGTKVTFAKLDATTRAFTNEHVITVAGHDVTLLDPALADGNVALLVRQQGDAIETIAVKDPASPLPAPTRVTGKLEATDRAGRMYVREDADTVVVHGRGEPVRITGLTGWSLRPSPTGAQIAAFARSKLMLLDDQGSNVWSVGFPQISNATWTPDGQLVALAGDLAKLDAANGRVVAAQCGWGFGVRREHPAIPDFPSTTETLCDH